MAKEKVSNSLETGNIWVNNEKKMESGEKNGIIFRKTGHRNRQIFLKKFLGMFLKKRNWRKRWHQFFEFEKMANFWVSKTGTGENKGIKMVGYSFYNIRNKDK